MIVQMSDSGMGPCGALLVALHSCTDHLLLEFSHSLTERENWVGYSVWK